MRTIAATEFQKHYGEYVDNALNEPIIIERHSRKQLVLVSFKDFSQLEQIKQQYNDLLLKLKMDEAKQGEYVSKDKVLDMLADISNNNGR